MSAAQKYQNKAQVSQLKAVGQIIVDFGTDQADDCCNAYEVLKHTAGMDVVEFDMPVHAFGPPDTKVDSVDDAPYPDDNEDTHPPRIAIDVIPEPTPKSDASSPASTTQACPDWRKECTLIVVLNRNAEDELPSPDISKPYEDMARVTHLQALGQVILEFGKDKPTECCDASKALRRKAGVKIVEFNQPITAWVPDEPDDHGKPHSGARRLAHLWHIMPLIAAWLVIA